MLFTVETRAKSPEEIIVLFDGESQPDHLPQLPYNNTAIHVDNIPTREDFTCTEVYELDAPPCCG